MMMSLCQTSPARSRIPECWKVIQKRLLFYFMSVVHFRHALEVGLLSLKYKMTRHPTRHQKMMKMAQGKREWEDDAASSSSSESELNNCEGRGEEDAASTSSSESVLNNCISQEFLQRVQGHYCSICCEQHYLTSTDLATFETGAQCEHI